METHTQVTSTRTRNYTVSKIKTHLEEGGVVVSKVPLFALFKKYATTNRHEDMKRVLRPQILVEVLY